MKVQPRTSAPSSLLLARDNGERGLGDIRAILPDERGTHAALVVKFAWSCQSFRINTGDTAARKRQQLTELFHFRLSPKFFALRPPVNPAKAENPGRAMRFALEKSLNYARES